MAAIDYDENSHKIAAEQELKTYSTIVESITSTLIKRIQSLTLSNPSSDILSKPHQVKPVLLNLSPYEQERVYNVRSDVELTGKVVLVLTSLCHEMSKLTDEALQELMTPIALYGEDMSSSACESNGEVQEMMALLLPTLNRVQCFRQRCQDVLCNVIQQFNVLYPAQQPPGSVLINVKEVHLQVVWEHLGRMLASIVALEEIISINNVLHEHWGAYRRLVRNAPTLLDDKKNSTDEEHLFDRDSIEPLLHMLDDIERSVMQGSMFKGMCQAAGNSNILRNNGLRDELHAVLLGWCTQLDNDAALEQHWWCDLQLEVVAVTCLYILHHTLYDASTTKTAKALLSLFKKVPCVTLWGSVVWHGERYISATCTRLNSFWDTKTCEALMQYRRQYLLNKVNNLPKLSTTYKIQVASWSTEMIAAATKPASQFSRQDLSHRTALFLQGIVFGLSVKYTVSSVLNLHAALSRPLGKACVLSVCSMLNTLHTIRSTYDVHSTRMLAHTLPLVSQFLVAQLLAAIRNTKLKAVSHKQRGVSSTDVLACLSIVEQCLGCAAPTTVNTNTARIALSLANVRDVFKDNELTHLVLLLRRLELSAELQRRIHIATHTGPLLYSHSIIIHTYLKCIADGTNSPLLLEGLLDCVNHAAPVLKLAKHVPEETQLMNSFRNTLCEALLEQVVGSVCTAVETELRISTHSYLQLQPLKSSLSSTTPLHGIRDPVPILSLPPLNCLGKVINLKECVEQYLSRTFYALTVVAPHDCHTYQEMRVMAQHKWNLHVISPGLPSHTIHQGVDVLEVMRNMPVFVRSYHYSLSQQVFVEAESSSKFFNTLNITHIANSIRTHGAGIINTTVNYTYQFLVSKFKIFSQFLFDEQIKSRLVKDRRHWKDVRTPQEKWFPFDRAEKFNLGIRKLGLSPQGLSYLDQFRGLVTQMGNAMGFVRLVRSGGLRCSSNTVRFLPNISQLTPFTDLSTHHISEGEDTTEVGASSTTHDAARNLDMVIQNLQQAFQQDTDYFKILVEVFSNALLSGDANSHLRNFYLIVPALCINFVHYAIGAKDLLNKKNRAGAAFTMDGFAMGTAYLLSVLDQGSMFDSLHWWSGVRRYFISQTEKVEKQRSDCVTSGDHKLAETLSLTLARLQQHQQEHELLYLTLTSARGFFRGTKSRTSKPCEDNNKDVSKSSEGDVTKQ